MRWAGTKLVLKVTLLSSQSMKTVCARTLPHCVAVTSPPPPPEDGCRMEAQFFIKKVPGNFHLSTHSSRVQPEQVDMRHIIHRLEFGEDSLAGSHLKGSFDPLRDIDKTEVPCMKVWRGVGWGGDCMHASHAAPSPPTTQLTTPTTTT